MKSKLLALWQKFKGSDMAVKAVMSVLVGSGVSFLLFYIFLPAFNLRSIGFWIYLTACILAYAAPFMEIGLSSYTQVKQTGKKKVKRKRTDIKVNKWAIIPPLVPLSVLLVGLIISSTLFNARRYASIIEVKEYDFAEDMPVSTEVTNIALMDTDSATVLGNRVLGSLSDMVSQYTVSDYYTQINYNGAPKKVSNLEYDGFFKWIGNRDSGIPGMVMVDPVKSGAEYIAFSKPMHYADSAFFGEDLTRKLRFEYPTKIFDSISFEVDDQGNPYYIVSCVKPTVGMFGAKDINEVIIFDPTDGSSKIMATDQTPSWIDVVFTGDLACQKYNWYGTLAGGFINSIIGNVGCTQSTDDFGYIVLGDDVWYFTGVTSLVSNDKSNIGFILSNARTGEYKFYPVIGAEEHSAMSAAEGEVQEKGYVASFPSLVNIANQPTYIMVLKDAVGVVKLYALVNVENYGIVATGDTQAEAMSAYKKLLRQNNVDIDVTAEETTVSVTDVRLVTVSGVATVYISADDGKVYKGYLESDEALVLIKSGDMLNIKYTPGDVEDVRLISSWERN